MIKSREELYSRVNLEEDSKEHILKIVAERLEYLNSEEYKDRLHPTIYGNNDEAITLKQGFITNEEIIRIL